MLSIDFINSVQGNISLSSHMSLHNPKGQGNLFEMISHIIFFLKIVTIKKNSFALTFHENNELLK